MATLNRFENISNKTGSIITYLNNTDHRGLKFKD